MKIPSKYLQIWELARLYYEKGRPMDIDHIEWMITDATLLCEKEDLASDLLLPLVILHDVGYSNVPKDNPFNLDLRQAHMAEGAKIAAIILAKLKYPIEIIDKIAYLISVHDNWALGDNEIYKKEKILASFNDLDFMWMATPKGFPALIKILNKTGTDMIDFLEHNEKLVDRPFATTTAKSLFNNYLAERSGEISKSDDSK